MLPFVLLHPFNNSIMRGHVGGILLKSFFPRRVDLKLLFASFLRVGACVLTCRVTLGAILALRKKIIDIIRLLILCSL